MTDRLAIVLLAILVLFGLSRTTVVEGFAAKKKPNKKKNTASSNKGFGAAPPTLDEVVSKFKNRLPENAADLPCPCGISEGLAYKDCCQPYHQGLKEAETPLRVLQSRYSAFKYRLIAHIIKTTHPQCRDWKDNKLIWAKDMNKQGMFDSFDFIRLSAGETQFVGEDNDNNKATIEFQVRLRSKDGNQEETVVSEKSLFLRDPSTNVWSYASGEVRSEVAGLEDAILNQ